MNTFEQIWNEAKQVAKIEKELEETNNSKQDAEITVEDVAEMHIDEICEKLNRLDELEGKMNTLKTYLSYIENNSNDDFIIKKMQYALNIILK